jgi:hypothetical protein
MLALFIDSISGCPVEVRPIQEGDGQLFVRTTATNPSRSMLAPILQDRQLLLQSLDQASFDNTVVLFLQIGVLTGGIVAMQCKQTP